MSARSYAEYQRMFRLQVESGASVLDCAGGGSSFAAGARRVGVRAVAVDPLYALPISMVQRLVYLGLLETGRNIVAEPDRYRWGQEFGSPVQHLAARSTSAELFLKDFALRRNYVAASITRLPFAPATFDLVLCSHLLFLHAAIFSLEFHHAAIDEMMRVAAREVQIFPIVGFHAPADHLVASVLSRINGGSAGWFADLQQVPYEFLQGTSQMLRIRRR